MGTNLDTIPILHLRPGKDEPMERRHPWVFSGALDRRDTNGLMEGDLVELRSSTDDFVARGYWSPENIAIRILTFDASEEIDQAFWTRRLSEALRVREAVGLAGEHNALRWIYGEGDGLPGLIIDLYDSIAVMQAHTLGIHRQRHQISDAMSTVLGSRLQVVYYKSAETLTASSPIEGEIDELLMGSLPREQEVVIDERGMKFYLDVVKGQKTGFFLDQRDNRSLLRQYAKGRKVLNMFCYTGGFSLAAMLGEARQVVSVDSSERAIDMTARNMELNFPGRDDTHEEIATDAFAYLEGLQGGEYDLMVLDPPAFAKNRRVLSRALNGYRRLNRIALQKIAPSSLLFTFSCSQVVSPEKFQEAVFTAALQAGREVRILHRLTQAADHPVNIYRPEGEYLKGLVLYVK